MYVHAACYVGIADLRDESDRDGIRMVIELKRDAVPQVHDLYCYATY
jgi:DNA gyrase/topoisomerase IV subunit A